MIATIGWVEDIGPTDVLIKLKAGRSVRVPRRNGLKWGESVRVFWEEESMRVGNIMTLDELHILSTPKDVAVEHLPGFDYDIHDIIDSL